VNSRDSSSIPFFNALLPRGLVLSHHFRTSSVIFMEQKCGPHIEQKCADFGPSCGKVSSWSSRAVSGIAAEIELIFPAKFKTRFAQGVVAKLRVGMAFLIGRSVVS